MAKKKAPTNTGQQVNDLIIKRGFNSDQATLQVLGQFNPFIPPGSQVLSRGVNGIVYIDPDGYLHTQEREGDANSADFGRLLADRTDRPAVLPLSKTNSEMMTNTNKILQDATSAVQKGLSGELGTLTASDKALLDQMTQSTMEQLRQQFTTQGGQLVAQLYGRGMNESSLANDAVSRLEQSQGLVTNQAMSDAAARELSIRQFLTQLTTGAGVDLINSLTGTVLGNETQRGIASANVGLGQQQLEQGKTDSARNFQLENEKLNIARSQASPWRSILSAVASLGASAFAGPIGGAIAGKLTGGLGGGMPTSDLPNITFGGR